MKIVWSHLAEVTYYDNLSYLNENWPLSVISSFITDVEKTMSLVKNNPEIFNWWDSNKKYRVGFINKHISFLYSFTDKEILIHLFWNNHRDPSHLKKFL